jgi:hypothetical protein
LIVGGVILLILFIACIFAQQMKFREYLINLTNRCFKRVPPQESTHTYDLQACTTNDTINVTDGNPTITKLPPIQKVSGVIVPRSKRLSSLDAFRGFGKTNKFFFFKKIFLLFFLFSFNRHDLCQLWWWWLYSI